MNPSSNCHPPNESSSFAKKEERMRSYYGANNKPATLKERIKMRKRISLLAAHEEEVAIDPYYSSSSPSLASFSSSSSSFSESSQSIATMMGDGIMPPPMNAIVDASRRSSVLEAASALASLFGGGGDAFSSCPVVPPADPPSSSPPLAALEGAASESQEGDSSSATGHALWSRSFALSLGADVPLTFPQKLMMALSDPDSSDILSWLPHGKGFVIRNKRRFANEVMPRHFGGRASGIAKYTSFTRKLNRWGYKRVVSGKEVGAYYHDQFRRGDADACERMRPLLLGGGGGGGAMATAYGASEDDDDETKDDAREDEATNTTSKKDVPVEEALGRGDEMPPPSSRSLNGKPSKSVQPSFGLPREGNLQQSQYPMFRSVQQEDRRQQLQPSTVQGSSVQLSPTQHQLQHLALLQHQQKVLQQQQQLLQQQPLAHLLSMKSTPVQQKLLLLRLQQQQLQLQLHRNARHAETASSLAVQNLLGVDTTSSRNHQQIISNSLSVLKSHIERGLLDITTPAAKAASAYASSLPPAAPCDVRGHVHAKMLARPREEVDECDDRGGGKRQRAATTTSLASSSSSSPPAVDDRAVLMSQSKRPKKTNRRLAASRAQNDLARLWNEINSRTQLLASSNVSAPPPLPPRPKRKYSRPVRRASASAA